MDVSGPAQSQPAAAGAEQLHPTLAALLARKALLKGRFKIDEFLDMGGFATVFRCLDTKTGKEVRRSQRLMNSTSPAWQAAKLHVDNCNPANRQTCVGTSMPANFLNHLGYATCVYLLFLPFLHANQHLPVLL
jgi:hypothetical protein